MIQGYIGDLIITIVHVGSISVEGLTAKSIIDIDGYWENKSSFIDDILKNVE